MFCDINNNKINMREQNFSSTDLAKTGDIGIVFPIKKTGENQINIASIIDRDDNDVLLKKTEARIVSDDDKCVYYEEGATMSYVKKTKELKYSQAQKEFLGLEDKSIDAHYITAKRIEKITPQIRNILAFWEKCDFKPKVFVNSENLSKKVIQTYTYGGKGYNYTYQPSLFDYGLEETNNIDSNDLKEINKYVRWSIGEDDSNMDYIISKKDFMDLSIEGRKSYIKRLKQQLVDIMILPDGFENFKKIKSQNEWEEAYEEMLESLYEDAVSLNLAEFA